MFNRTIKDPDGNVREIMWMDAAALAEAPRSA
jgi:predicted lactoylglutathione lyase